MHRFQKYIGAAAAASVLLFSLAGALTASAATSPTLGAAATYAILSSTYTNTTAGTTVTGDIGFTTGPAVAPGGVHTYYGSGAPYSTAVSDQGTALSALAAQPCTFTFASGPIDLSTDTTHGTLHIYTPGVYCSDGAMSVSGPLTLSGTGTYIFRAVGALNSTDGSVVTLTGASACDVFWTPSAATTLGANTTFFGTIIDAAGITIGANTTMTGRALAAGGTVTTDTDTITAPTSCTVTTPSTTTTGTGGGALDQATLTVVKVVTNDNGGTQKITGFPLFVNGIAVISGTPNIFAAPATFTVTETSNANYAGSFSGDCDANGTIKLNDGDDKVCIITNNDIGAPAVPPVPPLIDVVKVPTPLALPAGPGPVMYTYTLHNVGTVPVTDITMVGDSCSPVTLVSGDTNNNKKLEVNETWVYRCSTTLTATHTNTITATGWANGLSAVDIATATVVVGQPVIPPLIHVTKIPSPLTLFAGGGSVTYTEKITNPGAVALNNVSLSDNTCSPMVYNSGDTNGDQKLDTNETWTYTCKTNLTQTTTNTAIASGEANGLVAHDYAVATVVVAIAAPKLPNTGIAPEDTTTPLGGVFAGVSLLALASLFLFFLKKQKS